MERHSENTSRIMPLCEGLWPLTSSGVEFTIRRLESGEGTEVLALTTCRDSTAALDWNIRTFHCPLGRLSGTL